MHEAVEAMLRARARTAPVEELAKWRRGMQAHMRSEILRKPGTKRGAT